MTLTRDLRPLKAPTASSVVPSGIVTGGKEGPGHDDEDETPEVVLCMPCGAKPLCPLFAPAWEASAARAAWATSVSALSSMTCKKAAKLAKVLPSGSGAS